MSENYGIDSTMLYIVDMVNHVKKIQLAFNRMFKKLQSENSNVTREQAVFLFAYIMRDSVEDSLKEYALPN